MRTRLISPPVSNVLLRQKFRRRSSMAAGKPPCSSFCPGSPRQTSSLFHQALAAYDADDENHRLLNHSLLLDQGIMLCEPSTQLEGMAGASLGGGNSWIAVPLSDIRDNGCKRERRAVCRC